MSPSETIRALLDERGIKYKAISNTCTEVHVNGIKYTFYEYNETSNDNLEGKVFALTEWLAPEQAVAATVGAGTCKNLGGDTFICSKCGAHVKITNVGRSYLDENGKRWYGTSNEHEFRHCPNCGARIIKEVGA